MERTKICLILYIKKEEKMDLKKNNPSKLIQDYVGFRPIVASGGDESFITVNGILYKLHVFTDTTISSLNVQDKGSEGIVEYLVVGGGGGGGMDMGGGGGGGGVVDGRLSVDVGSIIVKVGDGGWGGPAGGGGYRGDARGPQPSVHQFTIPATSGENSFLGNIVALGGGFGGSSYRGYTPGIQGGAGGSGGGASGYNDNAGTFFGGAGTAGQGFRGGNSTAAYYSGGGGGANGPGVDSTGQPNGGQGKPNSILGRLLYWGGGGGGSSYTLSTGGNGGIGGGGGGAVGSTVGGIGINDGQPGGGGSPGSQTNTPGGDAGRNTGGGGGGGSHYNLNNRGGNGGSGIVVVRYPVNTFLPKYITENLMLYLDAQDPASYPGTGSTWFDLSGNGFNATLINSPTWSNSGFFSFNGTNQTASIATNPNIYGVISCEIWIYFNNISSNPVFMHKGVHYTVQVTGTNTYQWADSSNYSYANYGNRTATGIGTTGTWKQIIITKNTSNDVKVYINGVLSDTRSNFTGVITNNTTTFWLVGYSDTTSVPTSSLVNGNVALCRIYNRELKQSEITSNFNCDRSRFGL
jgi:hypothetical protein